MMYGFSTLYLSVVANLTHCCLIICMLELMLLNIHLFKDLPVPGVRSQNKLGMSLSLTLTGSRNS